MCTFSKVPHPIALKRIAVVIVCFCANGANGRARASSQIATGDLTPDEESRTGLVAAHAYAVLAMKEVNGVRLVYIKNPWNKGRWKGEYRYVEDTHIERAMVILNLIVQCTFYQCP